MNACKSCEIKDEIIRALQEALSVSLRLNPSITPYSYGSFDPSKCPCNPALGGSGVCGCIMGGIQVTCQAAT